MESRNLFSTMTFASFGRVRVSTDFIIDTLSHVVMTSVFNPIDPTTTEKTHANMDLVVDLSHEVTGVLLILTKLYLKTRLHVRGTIYYFIY